MAATEMQVGGNHYLKLKIQPTHFVAANNWDAFALNILKYLTRWRDKAGLVDIEKSVHYAHLRVELGMEDYYPHRLPRKAISMIEYIEVNGIHEDVQGVLFALERWVMSGSHSVRFRAEFIAAVEAYFEFQKKELNQ